MARAAGEGGKAGRGGMLVCFCGGGRRGMEGRVAEEV